MAPFLFDLLVALVAFAAGGVAAVAGFGIGSLLTPLLASQIGTSVAVALISVPHFTGTLLRLLLIRRHVDRRVLLTFGAASAAGGLAGALLHARFTSAVLGTVLALLLIFAGLGGLAGWTSRLRFGRRAGWVAGAVSGLFGGLVGNQGGIRSAALMGFDLDKQSFVATATAIALVVDVFRMPVYAATQWNAVSSRWPLVLVSTAAVVAGTIFGRSLLRRIPDAVFRATVFGIILALGVLMLLHPGGRD